MQALAGRGYERVVYLGSHIFKGLAREAALKLLELTDGGMIAAYDFPMGFRHGPKTIVNGKTLVVVFLSNNAYTRRYDLDLLDEIARDGKSAGLIAISARDDGLPAGVGQVLIPSMRDAEDVDLLFPFIVAPQIFAFEDLLARGRLAGQSQHVGHRESRRAGRAHSRLRLIRCRGRSSSASTAAAPRRSSCWSIATATSWPRTKGRPAIISRSASTACAACWPMGSPRCSAKQRSTAVPSRTPSSGCPATARTARRKSSSTRCRRRRSGIGATVAATTWSAPGPVRSAARTASISSPAPARSAMASARAKSARAGGWSEIFGDEGSAYWIAVQGLNIFTRMSDGRLPKGPLYDVFRASFGLSADLDLCGKVMQAHTRGSIAAISQLVTRAAQDGDAHAMQVFDDAARELAPIAEAVRRALEFAPGEDVPLSYSGGVFNTGAPDPRAVPAPSRGAARHVPADGSAGRAEWRSRDLRGQACRAAARFGGHQAPGGLSTQCARAKR